MTDSKDELRKIRNRLRSYERKLRKEKEESGFYDDSAGKRYLIGPHYLLLGDDKGAFEAFQWFEQEFSEDVGEPGHLLCWTLALHRSGNEVGAARKLRYTVLSKPLPCAAPARVANRQTRHLAQFERCRAGLHRLHPRGVLPALDRGRAEVGRQALSQPGVSVRSRPPHRNLPGAGHHAARAGAKSSGRGKVQSEAMRSTRARGRSRIERGLRSQAAREHHPRGWRAENWANGGDLNQAFRWRGSRVQVQDGIPPPGPGATADAGRGPCPAGFRKPSVRPTSPPRRKKCSRWI